MGSFYLFIFGWFTSGFESSQIISDLWRMSLFLLSTSHFRVHSVQLYFCCSRLPIVPDAFKNNLCSLMISAKADWHAESRWIAWHVRREPLFVCLPPWENSDKWLTQIWCLRRDMFDRVKTFIILKLETSWSMLLCPKKNIPPQKCTPFLRARSWSPSIPASLLGSFFLHPTISRCGSPRVKIVKIAGLFTRLGRCGRRASSEKTGCGKPEHLWPWHIATSAPLMSSESQGKFGERHPTSILNHPFKQFKRSCVAFLGRELFVAPHWEVLELCRLVGSSLQTYRNPSIGGQ